MRRHARLRQAHDRRQLGHGQLLAFEQRQQAHPGRVGEQAQQGSGRAEIQEYPFILIKRYMSRLAVRTASVNANLAKA